ncbi:MAG: hypothetical protein V1650_03445 [Candidatus Omnitrophota bacterium]
MAKNFYLDILTPEKTVYSGEISFLIVSAEFGYLGVLADHAPLIAALKPGKIIFAPAQGSRITLQLKASGFLEVLKNRATVLLDREI